MSFVPMSLIGCKNLHCKDISIFGFILQFPSLNSVLDGPQKAYLKKQFVFITFTFFPDITTCGRMRGKDWANGIKKVNCRYVQGTNINKSLFKYN